MSTIENLPISSLSKNVNELIVLDANWNNRKVKEIKYDKYLISLEQKIRDLKKDIDDCPPTCKPEDLVEAKKRLISSVKLLKDIRKNLVLEEDSAANKIKKLFVRFLAWITRKTYVEVPKPLLEKDLERFVKDAESIVETKKPAVPEVDSEKKNITKTLLDELKAYERPLSFDSIGKWCLKKEDANTYMVEFILALPKKFQIEKGGLVIMQYIGDDKKWHNNKEGKKVKNIKELFDYVEIDKNNFIYVDEIVWKIDGEVP